MGGGHSGPAQVWATTGVSGDVDVEGTEPRATRGILTVAVLTRANAGRRGSALP